MRKLKMLVMTLAMTLLLAAPALAVDNNAVANIGGSVAINSFNFNTFGGGFGHLTIENTNTNTNTNFNNNENTNTNVNVVDLAP